MVVCVWSTDVGRDGRFRNSSGRRQALSWSIVTACLACLVVCPVLTVAHDDDDEKIETIHMTPVSCGYASSMCTNRCVLFAESRFSSPNANEYIGNRTGHWYNNNMIRLLCFRLLPKTKCILRAAMITKI